MAREGSLEQQQQPYGNNENTFTKKTQLVKRKVLNQDLAMATCMELYVEAKEEETHTKKQQSLRQATKKNNKEKRCPCEKCRRSTPVPRDILFNQKLYLGGPLIERLITPD